MASVTLGPRPLRSECCAITAGPSGAQGEDLGRAKTQSFEDGALVG